MNRREFTRGLAALGLTPALPVPAIGSPAAVATATADKMYFVGWYTAKLNKTCSPEVLVSELNVNSDVAHQIFNKLVKTNTITPPNALGISQTVDPLRDTLRRANRQTLKRVVTEKSKTLKRHMLEASEDDPEINNDEIPVESDEATQDLTLPEDHDTLDGDQLT